MSQLIKRNHVLVSGSNQYSDVLYLMTKTFRIQNNYSLHQSVTYANKHDCKLRIGILEPFETNQRNLDFFHQYLDDLKEKLHQFSDDIIDMTRSDDLIKKIGNVHTIFVDKAYLKHDLDVIKTLKTYAYETDTIIIEVESNVFVPVLVASDKEEYAARTIRKKINEKLGDFSELVLQDAEMSSGEKDAWDLFQRFKDERLDHYDEHNDPSKHYTSNLSPYLKYGYISPVSIYHQLKEKNDKNTEDFLEELIVRRELAYNYVYYNRDYDQFDSMTEPWAYQTMNKHLHDEREHLYDKQDYLSFKTHDPYFNAAMKEMVYLGRMHSYMRMYWCKKIIEWSKTYQEAYTIALELNNHYFLDGFTPNGYTGVAWCFGKHDRAWFERDIFGKLRYMNDSGLKRKFDIEAYVEEMNQIQKEAE